MYNYWLIDAPYAWYHLITSEPQIHHSVSAPWNRLDFWSIYPFRWVQRWAPSVEGVGGALQEGLPGSSCCVLCYSSCCCTIIQQHGCVTSVGALPKLCTQRKLPLRHLAVLASRGHRAVQASGPRGPPHSPLHPCRGFGSPAHQNFGPWSSHNADPGAPDLMPTAVPPFMPWVRPPAMACSVLGVCWLLSSNCGLALAQATKRTLPFSGQYLTFSNNVWTPDLGRGLLPSLSPYSPSAPRYSGVLLTSLYSLSYSQIIVYIKDSL